MAKAAPCKNCLERCVGCHAWCDLYKAWHKQHEAERARNKPKINIHAEHVHERWLKKQK